MSGQDWLSRYDPALPAELATAMRTAVGAQGEGEREGEGKSGPTANDLLEAAERLLDKVLRTDCETRASALDLLTVDALMTHALQLANEDPKLRNDFPDKAMKRIASAREP